MMTFDGTDQDLVPTADLVVVGASAGGLRAVRTLLEHGVADRSFAFVVAMHRSGDSLGLAAALGHGIADVDDKDMLIAGRSYLAPAGYHLLVDGASLALSVEDPVRFSRPSIDVLFESAADAFGPRTTGVILTGGNQDGARGLARIARAGGRALVQHPATAEAGAMPRAALKAVPDAELLDLEAIAATLREFAPAEEFSHDG